MAVIEDKTVPQPTMEVGMGGVEDDSPPDARAILPGIAGPAAEAPHDPGGQGPMMRRGRIRRPSESGKGGDFRPGGTSRDPTVGSFAAFEQHQLVDTVLEVVGNGTAAQHMSTVPSEADVRGMSIGELKDFLAHCKIERPGQVPRRPKPP